MPHSSSMPSPKTKIPSAIPPIIAEMFSVYHAALDVLQSRLDHNFIAAIDLIYHHTGHVIISGMGKSGLIGRKIAATLSSTGTPSIFLHPAEAMHGDLGILRDGDVMLALSNSGETEELVRLLPALHRKSIRIISLTGSPSSTLGRASKICLVAATDREACPLNLAPTTSSLTALVLGDALAIALMERRGFRPSDFAATHPGGKLGRQLLLTTGDSMRTSDLPFVSSDAVMSDVILSMTRGRLGLAIVGTPSGLKGIITDGDLRRLMTRLMAEGKFLSDFCARDVMNPAPQTVLSSLPLGRAEALMAEQRIQCLIVVSDTGQVEGVLQIF